MQGRRLGFSFPWPIRPDCITADFFEACGFSVAGNVNISPAETIGKMLKVRFEKEAKGKYRPIQFEAIGPKNFFEPNEDQSIVPPEQI
jgi:hypothetical protein